MRYEREFPSLVAPQDRSGVDLGGSVLGWNLCKVLLSGSNENVHQPKHSGDNLSAQTIMFYIRMLRPRRSNEINSERQLAWTIAPYYM